MKLLFFGSPEMSVPSLRALQGGGHRVATVVTRPDRPGGRGRHPTPTAVKEAALEMGLEVLQPDTANGPEAIRALRGVGAELGVVVAYGEILSPELLSVTDRGFINVHASLLPEYRGAAPINWAVIRGEEVTGVTVIRMVPELDAGPILAAREVPIEPGETAGELHDRLAEIGAEVVLDVVDRLDAGEKLPARAQPREAGFFARKLTKRDGRLDWSLSAEELHNRVRGLTPWPGAYTRLEAGTESIRITVLRAEVAERSAEGRAPGTVLSADEEAGIVVQTGRGALRLLELKPAGGRAMSAADFVHGYPVEPGKQLH
ncbi:MAG: methionyl-tRNA formyltransferase [Candidatus Brocadiaceae bacterium]|jgi:methionyl-tRNA formyltransferase